MNDFDNLILKKEPERKFKTCSGCIVDSCCTQMCPEAVKELIELGKLTK